jgi:uncharacterized protein (TIGR02271 family)
MTTHAEELVGAQVTGADGKVIGTIEHVFEDDTSGAPAWASVRSGKASRFVPLGGGEATGDGLSVPFDAETIMTSPRIEAGKHMSAAQAEELVRYYDLVPAQPPPRGKAEEGQQRGKAEEGQRAKEEGQRAKAEEGQRAKEEGQRAKAEEGQRAKAEQGRQRAGEDADWLLRREQQLQVGTETHESGHVKLHRYVDAEPAEKVVHLFHEEYDVERVPVSGDEPAGGDLAEGEQEVTLHEERGIVNKQTVPVERMRLVTKRVEEDKTFRDELQRERIEVEPE